MRQPFRVPITIAIGLLAILLTGCARGSSITPGTVEEPRTVQVAALDSNDFVPAHIAVRAGETVRFVVTNEGALQHEFMIGSREQMRDHAVAVTHGGHGEDYATEIHLNPGQTKELVYTFGSSTDIGYACFMRSHFPASMSGNFEILD